MFFITSFLYPFNPQLKSFNLIPEVFLAAQLNILDGKFLNIRITTIFLNIMINCHIDDQDYGY